MSRGHRAMSREHRRTHRLASDNHRPSTAFDQFQPVTSEAKLTELGTLGTADDEVRRTRKRKGESARFALSPFADKVCTPQAQAVISPPHPYTSSSTTGPEGLAVLCGSGTTSAMAGFEVTCVFFRRTSIAGTSPSSLYLTTILVQLQSDVPNL